jgi:dTMP kinase
MAKFIINNKGKIIVFEGADASGKGTQSKLLYEYLINNHIKSFFLDFPQYNSFYGRLISKYLKGELGKLNEVSPYFVSLAFALDRLAFKEEIVKRLNDGNIIVANRYVTSNLAHQVVKFDNEKEQNELKNWIEELEYSVNCLPRENIVIYLDMPEEFSSSLLKKKGEREYIGKGHDIQEKDKDYQRKTISLYRHLSLSNPHWIKISCVEHGVIRSITEIHKEVLKVLRDKEII